MAVNVTSEGSGEVRRKHPPTGQPSDFISLSSLASRRAEMEAMIEREIWKEVSYILQ